MSAPTAATATDRFNSGMIAFAERAATLLEASVRADAVDLTGLADGLREALDTGVLLQHANDQGVTVSWEAVAAVERLLRAALIAQPYLQRTELNGAGDQQSLVAALVGRSTNANIELHKGLEAAYRCLLDAEEES